METRRAQALVIRVKIHRIRPRQDASFIYVVGERFCKRTGGSSGACDVPNLNAVRIAYRRKYIGIARHYGQITCGISPEKGTASRELSARGKCCEVQPPHRIASGKHHVEELAIVRQ